MHIHRDDLTGEATRGLLALHLAGMHAISPPGSVFALDLSGLQRSDVTVWTAWIDNSIAGVGALKTFGDGSAEIKSMRTHPDHLRKGVAAALLRHILAEARHRGLARVSLETGSGPAFDPALTLYRAHGFENGEAFADYRKSDFNQFLHLRLCDEPRRQAAVGRSSRSGVERRREAGSTCDRDGAPLGEVEQVSQDR